MTEQSSVTVAGREARGLLLGGLGVLAFSLTVPATRVAAPVLGGWTVGFGRAVGATVLAVAALALARAPLLPPRGVRTRLVVIGAGVVLGFPVLTSLALQSAPAVHAAVFIGLLPAATAGAAVLRAGERPSRRYWAATALGVVGVLGFAAGGGARGLYVADLLLLGAVAAAAVGYAEGAVLTREHGGRRVISWALICTAPVTVPLSVWAVAGTWGSATASSIDAQVWVAFGYVTVVSMFLGFLAWYAGLAQGGVARVGQLQLLQPFLSLGWAAWLLGERITPADLAAAGIVLLAVALGRRASVSTRRRPPHSATDPLLTRR